MLYVIGRWFQASTGGMEYRWIISVRKAHNGAGIVARTTLNRNQAKPFPSRNADEVIERLRSLGLVWQKTERVFDEGTNAKVGIGINYLDDSSIMVVRQVSLNKVIGFRLHQMEGESPSQLERRARRTYENDDVFRSVAEGLYSTEVFDVQTGT